MAARRDSLDRLQAALRAFARRRDWEQLINARKYPVTLARGNAVKYSRRARRRDHL